MPVGSPGQDVTSHFCSTNGWHEWIGSRSNLCRCAAFFNVVSATPSSSGQVSCCSAASRELWTVGDFYGLSLNGFALRSRLRTLLATLECTGQFSQAGPVHGTGTPLVPLATQCFSHHPSLTVDLWFDMFVATLWRPGLTFRFPGVPGPTRRALDRNGF